LHAKHDKELLAPRISSISSRKQDGETRDSTKNTCCLLPNKPQPSLLSNVCCEDAENIASLNEVTSQHILLHPPPGKMQLKVAILTVSDRAAANAYPTGDLSGPSVHSTILSQIERINSEFGDDKVSLDSLEKRIVPDELDEIKTILLTWAKESYDIIFTTGGTGFATRDVTPEATLAVIERECPGLMSWASIELTKKQPLATLSRASAGICGKSIIINLPGSPSGASEVVRLLFPLLLHAVNDVNAS
jgi:gephyrin